MLVRHACVALVPTSPGYALGASPRQYHRRPWFLRAWRSVRLRGFLAAARVWMPSFRHRLNRAQQVQYDRSNAVAAIPIRATPRLLRAIEVLEDSLRTDDRARTERIAQAICDEICGILRVPPLRVQVGDVRPHDQRGELHGLYVPTEQGKRDRISVWMKTAKRGQVVAYRTFLRTLLHEVCHHLDTHLLSLPSSFHTPGFYQRESSLFNQRMRQLPAAPPVRRERDQGT